MRRHDRQKRKPAKAFRNLALVSEAIVDVDFLPDSV
jgi:hypothetical protein